MSTKKITKQIHKLVDDIRTTRENRRNKVEKLNKALSELAGTPAKFKSVKAADNYLAKNTVAESY